MKCGYGRVERMKSTKKGKVYVGLSGGVDSSVSALLLKKEGYDVIGVFIKVWQPDFIECTWKEDRLDAMRVAAVLDIPCVTLDLEKEYKKEVIDYMIDEYRRGRTPNPDVMCNKEVKFGAFYRWAKEQDKDAYIATGHYARHNGTSLLKSNDENKDQTYFLWALTKELMPSLIFPVGDMKKDEVRKRAKEVNLPVAVKKDSQGLCFVGTIDIKTLLKKYIEEKEGDVILVSGEVIGKHDGVMFHTVGERHGFRLTKNTVDEAPYYVVTKDLEKNCLVVSHEKPEEKKGSTIHLERTNWTEDIVVGKNYQARARYRAELASLLALSDNSFLLVSGTILSTSGQSLVIYDENKCIGGGIMK